MRLGCLPRAALRFLSRPGALCGARGAVAVAVGAVGAVAGRVGRGSLALSHMQFDNASPNCDSLFPGTNLLICIPINYNIPISRVQPQHIGVFSGCSQWLWSCLVFSAGEEVVAAADLVATCAFGREVCYCGRENTASRKNPQD